MEVYVPPELLAEQVKRGNQSALEKLAKQLKHLVLKDFWDDFSKLNEGEMQAILMEPLYKACLKFDPTIQEDFYTFAKTIIGKMLKEIRREEETSIKFPSKTSKRAPTYNKIRNEYFVIYGKNPSDEIVKEMLEARNIFWTLKEIEDCRQYYLLNYTSPLEDEKGEEIHGYEDNGKNYQIEEMMEIAGLDEQEKRIIRLSKVEKPKKSLSKIGEMEGLSKKVVQSKLRYAMAKIKVKEKELYRRGIVSK